MVDSEYKPILKFDMTFLKGHRPYLRSIDFINTWKIKDINVLTSIEILVSDKGKKLTMSIIFM